MLSTALGGANAGVKSSCRFGLEELAGGSGPGLDGSSNVIVRRRISSSGFLPFFFLFREEDE